jgi:hypothetical protein
VGEVEMRLVDLLRDPIGFYEGVRIQNWKPPFVFYLMVTVVLSVATSIVNYFGIESTDLSSAYQAQILIYRLLPSLVADFGVYAYIVEAFLILGLSVVILLLLTGFVHIVYRAIGGKGSVLNAWKSSCYGVGPCVLGGFIPYVSLFASALSLLLQLYIGPRTLYGAKESRALGFFAIILALTFLEMLTGGTTVGFLI